MQNIHRRINLVQSVGAGKDHKSQKVDLTFIIDRWLVGGPQHEELYLFLTENFPTIKTDVLNSVWGLAAYGSRAAFSALTFLITRKENLTDADINKMVDLAKYWIRAGCFEPTSLFVHRCNNTCIASSSKSMIFCQPFGRQAAFFNKVATVISAEKNTMVDKSIGRKFFALMIDINLPLCAEIVRNSFDSLEDDVAGRLFAMTTGRVRYLVFQKFSKEFRNSLVSVVNSRSITWNTNQEMYTPTNTYEMIFEMCGSCTPPEIEWVHSIFEIKDGNYNMTEFIAALNAGNIPLLMHMIRDGYPSFISNDEILLKVLQATSKFVPTFETVLVSTHIFKAIHAAKRQPKLSPYDAIELMSSPFFSLARESISSVTDWEQPYNCSHHPSSLVGNINCLLFLIHEGILQKWKERGKTKISLTLWNCHDAECLRILTYYGIELVNDIA